MISFLRSCSLSFIGLFFFISRIEPLYQILFSCEKAKSFFLWGFNDLLVYIKNNGRSESGSESGERNKKGSAA